VVSIIKISYIKEDMLLAILYAHNARKGTREKPG
jgi:hypothetical protein